MSQIIPHWHHRSQYNLNNERDVFMNKLNCQIDQFPLGSGCVVELPNAHIRVRTREDYWSFDCGYTLDEKTDSTQFHQLVVEAVGTEERAKFLQRWFGYGLTGHVRERKLITLYGSGNNGKSTILKGIRMAMGCLDLSDSKQGFFVEAGKELIMSMKNNDPNRPTPAVMMIHGKRIIAISETVSEDRLDYGLIKKLTSDGEFFSGRWLNCDSVQFPITAKLVIQTNSKPAIPFDQESLALWNRIIFMPFNTEYTDNPTEPHQRKIDTEKVAQVLANVPGILKWLILGAEAWYKEGLAIPQSVLDDTAAYKKENDHIGNFIETLELESPAVIASGNYYKVLGNEMHQWFMEWRDNRSEVPQYTRRQFGSEMVARGYKTQPLWIDGHTVKGYKGLKRRFEISSI